ncbi:MAG: hypothetical protein KF701_08725 [Anaerolineales bacterium]|nr:MAG: hypothetical protein KF701_08725 [Anaerolineales bacterium]
MYTLLAGFLVQFLLLPYIFPQWHAGDGLLIGIDATQFHSIAMETYKTLISAGWQDFILYPSGQVIAGIAGIFYFIFGPTPASMLPFNAGMHAVSGLLLYKILRGFSEQKSSAFLAAGFCIALPSTFLWTTQMHNETLSVLGATCFLFAWVQFQQAFHKKELKKWFTALVFLFTGLFLIGLVRDYLLVVYRAASLLLGTYLILRGLAKREHKYLISVAVTLLCLVFIQGIFNTFIQGSVRTLKRVPTITYLTNGITPGTPAITNRSPSTPASWWQKSHYIPQSIDNQVYSLILRREGAIRSWSEGSTGIDTDVRITSSREAILYTPRALQIALLSPFPSQWFEDGAKVASNFMKLIGSIEISAFYIIYVFFALGAYNWRGRPALHLIILHSIFFLTVFAIATPNAGNLYRFRYPYLIPIVGLGLTYFLDNYLHKFRTSL